MTSTLGIDLSSQPKHTAVCVIRWGEGAAEVADLRLGADDQTIVETIERERPAKVGMDAPLGWPVGFVAAVGDLDAWPIGIGESRAGLERRVTDHWVRTKTAELGLPAKLPLSVTTDRIAYPAMRAAGLLAALRAEQALEVDRSGVSGVVCETYPDPSIRLFGLWPDSMKPRASYKRGADDVRAAIVDRLPAVAPWLELSTKQRADCIAVDDCLDALICALVARAVERDLTFGPGEHADVARTEGWIHLPKPDVLGELVL